MAEDDYYKILGVAKNATKEEIKKAYKKKAKQHHPDLNKGGKDSEAEFKRINEAFSVLSDENKRARYDQFGKAGVDGQSGHSGFSGAGGFGAGFDQEGFDFGGGFSDIFDSLFGGRSRKNRVRKGSDLLFEIELTLEEAYVGGEKEIVVPKEETCKSCGGSGAQSPSDVQTCPICGGSGVVARQQRTPFGVFQSTSSCTHCNGVGKIVTRKCSSCKGEGKIKVKKNITLTIPKGIATGNKLRIRGEGAPGDRGGPAGDLYVEVMIKEHKLFDRDEDDLYTEVPISFYQAVVGDKIDVPTLDGSVSLKIPEGTSSGTFFKMRGKGMPVLNGSGYGNEFVKVVIETPKGLNGKQKKALKEFDKSLKTNPYKSFIDRVRRWM